MAEFSQVTKSNENDNGDVDMLERTRAEIKELRAQIQSLKKAIAKGDKKKKRENTAEITKLEQELKKLEKLKVELYSVTEHRQDEVKVPLAEGMSDVQEEPCKPKLDNIQEVGVAPNKQKSRAQKRKEKKNQQDKERDERIALEEAESAVNNPRLIERKCLETVLGPLGLVIKDVPPDGHCLYAAIRDQLSCRVGIKATVAQLRTQCSEYILNHSSKFLPYLTDPTSGNLLSEERFSEYCNEVAHTAVWGGQLEITALSCVYKAPIKVYQADCPIVSIGEEYDSTSLTISYHRHELGSGEHYNSIVVSPD